MQEKQNLTSKIIKYCNQLPDPCSSFLLETGTEMAYSTRLEYAKELTAFFDYLISYSPDFCEKEKRQITIADIRLITSQDISRYLTIYKDKGKKERTIARKRAALSRFFTYLTANRQIEYNPVIAAVKVKIHKSDEIIHLNNKEQTKFLNDIKTGDTLTKNQQKYHERYRMRDYTLVTLLLDTGMRVSELHGIDIPDFDFEECSVIITRKGGNIQTLYFSDNTRDIICDYINERTAIEGEYYDPNGPLFVTKKGSRLSIRAIEVLVKKYAISSIPGKGQKITPHKMRSSFAFSFYEQSNFNVLALKRELGHSSIQVLQSYVNASDATLQNMRNLVSDARNGDDVGTNSYLTQANGMKRKKK